VLIAVIPGTGLNVFVEDKNVQNIVTPVYGTRILRHPAISRIREAVLTESA
jgi:hypothetical protein